MCTTKFGKPSLVATSVFSEWLFSTVGNIVFSEWLFSTAGNIVSAKRAALLPENVEKLVFLHENLQFD